MSDILHFKKLKGKKKEKRGFSEWHTYIKNCILYTTTTIYYYEDFNHLFD